MIRCVKEYYGVSNTRKEEFIYLSFQVGYSISTIFQGQLQNAFSVMIKEWLFPSVLYSYPIWTFISNPEAKNIWRSRGHNMTTRQTT